MTKILVIDDDVDILQAVTLILQSEGYEVETTTKAEHSSKLIKKYKPELIILDVLLSGYDGRKICKQLKTEDQTKHIPVILMSAHPTAKKSIDELKGDSFIPKPFTINTIVTEVKKCLKKAK